MRGAGGMRGAGDAVRAGCAVRVTRPGREAPSGQERPPSRGRFTLAVFVAAVVVLVAWAWFAVVVEDTWGDECKARAAGQSGLSTLIVLGVVPLAVVTVAAVFALIGFAPGVRGGRVLRGLVAAVVLSGCGLVLAWWMTDGMLVAHLALGAGCLA